MLAHYDGCRAQVLGDRAVPLRGHVLEGVLAAVQQMHLVREPGAFQGLLVSEKPWP